MSFGIVLVTSHINACPWSRMGATAGPCQSSQGWGSWWGQSPARASALLHYEYDYIARETWYPAPDVWQGHPTGILSCRPPAVQLPIFLDQEYSPDTYVSTSDELESHINFSSHSSAPCLETQRTRETWKEIMVEVGGHKFQHQSSLLLLWAWLEGP